MTSITPDETDRLQYGREVGKRLRILAWEKRINQTKLGEAIGLSNATVSKKLRGDTPITIDELMGMAEVLGVEDPGQLLPRLDSNQQPSGYVSLLVGRQVLVWGWGGLYDYRGTIERAEERHDGELVVLVRDVHGDCAWLELDPALLVPLELAEVAA